jgi:hypothetical protein
MKQYIVLGSLTIATAKTIRETIEQSEKSGKDKAMPLEYKIAKEAYDNRILGLCAYSFNFKPSKLGTLTIIIILPILFIILSPLALVSILIGTILYYASKIIRGLAFLLLFNPEDAKSEMSYFWEI